MSIINYKQIKELFKKIVFKIKNNKVRYVSLREKFVNFINTKNLVYEITDLDKGTVLKYKNSDTLFILGSGSSIEEVTEKQWDIIAKNDSLAFNWFIYHKFIPKFYHIEYDRSLFFREFQKSAIKKRAFDYRNTVIFVHHIARKRGMHPRFMPDFFPFNPKCCFYKYPNIIKKPTIQPLTAEDFKNGFQIRGCLNLMLYIAYKMNYKNIVLMGVDLLNHIYFYDDYEKYPDAQWMERYNYNWADKETRKNVLYAGLKIDKNGKIYDPRKGRRPFHEIILAINQYVFEPKNIKLYIGTKKSLLSNFLPLYSF